MARHRTPRHLPPWLNAAPAIGALTAGFATVLLPATALAADRDCADFASQADAQAYFLDNVTSTTPNPDNLDANSNGQACEDFRYSVVGGVTVNTDGLPQGGVDAGDGSTE